MTDRPLAYHITFGTYGTRLHGDPRGTVDRLHNQPGDPIIGRNNDWLRLESSMLNAQPIQFNPRERALVEQSIDSVCTRGGWTCHAAACQANHVHVLLTSADESKLTRRLLKRWLTEHLNAQRELNIKHTPRWWAKGGSIKWVWDQAYFDNVFYYITNQRASTTELRHP